VLVPEGASRHKFLCYSDKVCGFTCHWNGRKPVPCYANHDLCEGGHKILNRRWKGYLHGFSFTRNEPVILQLTLEAANQLREQCDEGASFRGLTLYVSRSEKKKGRLSCQVNWDVGIAPANKLPPIIHPRRSVFNLWGVPYNEEPFDMQWDGLVEAEELAAKIG